MDACGDLDLYVVPSPWTKELFLKGLGPYHVPTPAERIVSLHAGVDTDFWKPSNPWGSNKRRKILLYDKSRVSDGFISRYLNLKKGYLKKGFRYLKKAENLNPKP